LNFKQVAELSVAKHELEQLLAAARAEADALRGPATRAGAAEAALRDAAARAAAGARERAALEARLRAAEEEGAARQGVIEEYEADLQCIIAEKSVRELVAGCFLAPTMRARSGAMPAWPLGGSGAGNAHLSCG
jgi:hypothetical protein